MDALTLEEFPAKVVVDDLESLDRAAGDHVMCLQTALHGYSIAEGLEPIYIRVNGARRETTIVEMISSPDRPLSLVFCWTTATHAFFVVVDQTPQIDWVCRQMYYKLAIPEGGEMEGLQFMNVAPQWRRREQDEPQDEDEPAGD